MRVRIASLLLVLLIGVAAVPCVSATPIKPDLKKLLSDPPKTQQYPPARAGWNGPEASASQHAEVSSSLARYGPQASARAMRASIVNLLIPDWKAIAGLLTVIMLLRFLRSRDESRRLALVMPHPSAPSELEQRAA